VGGVTITGGRDTTPSVLPTPDYSGSCRRLQSVFIVQRGVQTAKIVACEQTGLEITILQAPYSVCFDPQREVLLWGDRGAPRKQISFELGRGWGVVPGRRIVVKRRTQRGLRPKGKRSRNEDVLHARGVGRAGRPKGHSPRPSAKEMAEIEDRLMVTRTVNLSKGSVGGFLKHRPSTQKASGENKFTHPCASC